MRDFTIHEISTVLRVLTAPGGPVTTNDAQRQHGAIIETREHEVLLVTRPREPKARMAFERDALQAGVKVDRRVEATEEVIRCLYDTAHRSSRTPLLTEAEKGKPQVLVESIVRKAIELGASDIHIRTEGTHTDVSFRVHGDIIPMADQLTRSQGEQLGITLWNMKDQTSASDEFRPGNYQQCRIEQDFLVSVGDSRRTVRTQLRYQGSPMKAGAFKIVMRVQATQRAGQNRTLPECGYTDDQCTALEAAAMASDGLVLISGPVNSGKTVTLGAIGAFQVAVYGQRKVIATVEDPVELDIPGACQHPVVDKADGRGFDEAVLSALRQDVNTIILGEIRTNSTAGICRKAAETGHLIMSSVHATDAWATLTRITKLGIEIEKIGEPGFLRAICNQRLIPTLCEDCALSWSEKARDPLFTRQLNRVRAVIAKRNNIDRVRFKNHKGCEHCTGGSTGLRLVAEILVPDQHLCDLLQANDLKGAREYWTSGDLSKKAGLGPGNAYSSAFALIETGHACPFDVEHRFGQLYLPKDHDRPILTVAS
ncbi:hypothetical protein C7S18_23600 (plasmid) [Ahniella affigens]|uniref:Bacterial type II secretion system protein E domain-containing protein n=1 Tax=Ahniella affigens TaxID=2021234 RepID=A0A2P1PZP4_9GAMM|nr:ATPase, T2SS/T4P/T4SS family [Ahniella affigens]AVQ00285.1 hypothetical protein C7S18_23600 [Ahniella affigens]